MEYPLNLHNDIACLQVQIMAIRVDLFQIPVSPNPNRSNRLLIPLASNGTGPDQPTLSSPPGFSASANHLGAGILFSPDIRRSMPVIITRTGSSTSTRKRSC